MAKNPDVRWRQRFASFNKAFAQLSKDAYHERTADKISSAILSSYVAEFRKFQERFAELESENP